ncbi:hypothetical protein AAMO2058_001068500 [Amorphochlora amoebiformis]
MDEPLLKISGKSGEYGATAMLHPNVDRQISNLSSVEADSGKHDTLRPSRRGSEDFEGKRIFRPNSSKKMWRSRSLNIMPRKPVLREAMQTRKRVRFLDRGVSSLPALLESKKQRSNHRSPDPPRIPHTWVFSMLNPGSKKPQARAYKYFITFVIIVDAFLFVISTIPEIDVNYKHSLYYEEAVVSMLFCVEYITRLVVITQSRQYRHPCFGRMKYVLSGSAIIDLISFAPFIIELSSAQNLPTLTYIRMLRLVRILKTDSYAEACNSAARVLRFNSEILIVAFLMCIFLMLVTSTILYYLRPQQEADEFNSIPSCMYLAILMLTGQGVPDGALPWYTKLIVMTTAVFSVAMFAIPSSMLTWGFEAEAERMAHKRYLRERRKHKYRLEYNVEPPASDSSTTEDDEDTSDEEYFRQIAGISEDEKDLKQEAKKMYDESDKNKDQSLSFNEFWKLFQKLEKKNATSNATHKLNPLEAGTGSEVFLSVIAEQTRLIESLRGEIAAIGESVQHIKKAIAQNTSEKKLQRN